MSEQERPNAVADNRGRALGLGRLVMAVFWVFGVAMAGIAVWNLNGLPKPIGPRLVAMMAAVFYVLAAIGITHNGRRMRKIAWVSLIVSLIGPIIIGLAGLGLPADIPWDPSPWARFGATYWYLPLVIPIIGFAWMWWSDPRRIVVLAEGVERRPR